MILVNNPSHSRRSNHHRHNNRLHNIRRQVLLHFCAGTFSLKVKKGDGCSRAAFFKNFGKIRATD